MTKRDQVRQYLTEVLREDMDDTKPFADDDSLVLSGRLDSLGVVGVLTFLEERFDFSMDPNQFDQTKFDSVNSIMALLEGTPRHA